MMEQKCVPMERTVGTSPIVSFHMFSVRPAPFTFF